MFIDELEEVSNKNEYSNSLNRANIKRKLTDKKGLARFALFNILKDSEVFGARYFWVSCHRNSKILFGLNSNLDFAWIAIKFGKMLFLSAEDKLVLRQIPIDQIEGINVYPGFVEIKFENNEYYFNSNNNFEILNMYQEYRKLDVIVNEIGLK